MLIYNVVELTLSTLSKIFSRRHIEICFLIIPRKQDLIFQANCLHLETMCMKCQILFFGENKKNVTKLSSAELTQRVVKSNINKNLKGCLCSPVKGNNG